MIWNTSLAFRIFCTLIATTCCSGCSTVGSVQSAFRSYENHVDLSDSGSDEIATIRGEIFNVVFARIECWMRSPAYAKSVTVNAGIVDIEAECDGARANFRFEALAGHEYLIQRRTIHCDSCITLIDVTTDEVVVKIPYCLGKPCPDLSTGDDKAIIRAGKAKWGTPCKPTMGQGYFGSVRNLYVDAGPVTIVGVCDRATNALNFLIPRLPLGRIASFDFVAETGHTYTFAATEKECMRLLDITSEEIVIACEPYEKVELVE